MSLLDLFDDIHALVRGKLDVWDRNHLLRTCKAMLARDSAAELVGQPIIFHSPPHLSFDWIRMAESIFEMLDAMRFAYWLRPTVCASPQITCPNGTVRGFVTFDYREDCAVTGMGHIAAIRLDTRVWQRVVDYTFHRWPCRTCNIREQTTAYESIHSLLDDARRVGAGWLWTA